ncbi:hypothetical protein FOZ63_016848, partial [Perkinsus olseni]
YPIEFFKYTTRGAQTMVNGQEKKSGETTPNDGGSSEEQCRQQEAEEQRRQQETEELRRQQEVEELHRQQEAEESRSQQEAERIQREQEALLKDQQRARGTDENVQSQLIQLQNEILKMKN